MLLILIVAVLVLALWLRFLGTAGVGEVRAIPWRCPVCGAATEGSAVEGWTYWYRTDGRGHYTCRSCGAGLREHANGVLAPDPN